MATHVFRLRRAISLTSSIKNYSSIISVAAPPSSLSSSASSNPQIRRLDVTQLNPNKLPFQSRAFRSSEILLSTRPRSYNNNMDNGEQIDPDAILFEGCDYNHWLITMDFPKDPKPSAEEMVETYVQTAAKVLGSVEEAKKKIYACSTTTYQGFQVEVTEEMSEKFKGLPGVVFILPDSYIDPVNKEYGGDKYINGTIIHRPPPVQYGRQGRYGDRNREYNRPPRGQMQYNQAPQPVNRDPTPMNNAPGGQGNYQGDRRGPMPSYQGNYNQGERRDYYPPGQSNLPPRDQRNYPPPEQRDFMGDGRNYGPPQGGNYGGQGASGNYRQGDEGNYRPPTQGAGGSYGQGGNYGQGGGNYGHGLGGNYSQGGGDFGQGANGNFGQGASSNYGQVGRGNFGQGAGGDYGQGVGGAHGQIGSGYGPSSPGYGGNPGFPQVEQRKNVQGQPGNYSVTEGAGTTQERS